MLDSLGSTLSKETIDSFFTRHGKKPNEDEITTNEAIQCLEEEVCRPTAEKKRLSTDDAGAPDTSIPSTPMFVNNGNGAGQTHNLGLENIDFSGAPIHPTARQQSALVREPGQEQVLPAHPTEPNQQPLATAVQPVINQTVATTEQQTSSSSSSSDNENDESSGPSSDETFERIINVKSCPLCHRPRINKRAEVDIITHLAVCASQDWGRVDRIVVNNFVTASQAQRKWYTKVISKVSSGNYKLGAVGFCRGPV